ncbi:hypothetical protein [Bradyrhizobium sp. F1.13.3]|uniref:hypothetical protein n=1 Tax=Bradyrhizobium sp. F1.13.3 TaxID=3156351 RepID=UPI00339A44B2
MSQPVRDDIIMHSDLKTPKSAAVAGIMFSLLMFTIFGLLRRSIPTDPLEPGAWLAADTNSIELALNLVPFAGIAFLWFVGVLRDRLGHQEDRFFATVFIGSAMLFLVMLFTAAAVIGAVMLLASKTEPNELISSGIFRYARSAAFIVNNVYATKMAAVFMVSTSTIVIYTSIAPRWIAYIGYLFALLLLIGSYYIAWSFVILPAWVFLISAHILVDNLRKHGDDIGAR